MFVSIIIILLLLFDGDDENHEEKDDDIVEVSLPLATMVGVVVIGCVGTLPNRLDDGNTLEPNDNSSGSKLAADEDEDDDEDGKLVS